MYFTFSSFRKFRKWTVHVEFDCFIIIRDQHVSPIPLLHLTLILLLLAIGQKISRNTIELCPSHLTFMVNLTLSVKHASYWIIYCSDYLQDTLWWFSIMKLATYVIQWSISCLNKIEWVFWFASGNSTNIENIKT